jgi:hypothetical protein
MKFPLLTCCILPLVIPMAAHAGINGVYKVQGAEIEDGMRYNFTGTLTVINYKTGKYVLDLGDGEGLVSFKFNFSKRLKNIAKPQTVSYSNNLGSGTATFSQTAGVYNLRFNYREKGSNIRGSGTGSK